MRVEPPSPTMELVPFEEDLPHHGNSALLRRGRDIRHARRRQAPATQEESSHQETNTCTLILDFQAYGILLQQLMKTNPKGMVVWRNGGECWMTEAEVTQEEWGEGAGE